MIETILDKSDSLFRRYGLRSVTMSDIAKTLGVSKKTLYVHVENKSDLIKKLMDRHLSHTEMVLKSIGMNSKNAIEELLGICLYMQNEIKEVNPSLIYDLQKYHPQIWDLLVNFHDSCLFPILIKNMDKGKSEGLYREDLYPQVIAKIFVGTIPVISDAFSTTLKDIPNYIINKEFIKYHINGIVSVKGIDLIRGLLQKNKSLKDII